MATPTTRCLYVATTVHFSGEYSRESETTRAVFRNIDCSERNHYAHRQFRARTPGLGDRVLEVNAKPEGTDSQPGLQVFEPALCRD